MLSRHYYLYLAKKRLLSSIKQEQSSAGKPCSAELQSRHREPSLRKFGARLWDSPSSLRPVMGVYVDHKIGTDGLERSQARSQQVQLTTEVQARKGYQTTARRWQRKSLCSLKCNGAVVV